MLAKIRQLPKHACKGMPIVDSLNTFCDAGCDPCCWHEVISPSDNWHHTRSDLAITQHDSTRTCTGSPFAVCACASNLHQNGATVGVEFTNRRSIFSLRDTWLQLVQSWSSASHCLPSAKSQQCGKVLLCCPVWPTAIYMYTYVCTSQEAFSQTGELEESPLRTVQFVPLVSHPVQSTVNNGKGGQHMDSTPTAPPYWTCQICSDTQVVSPLHCTHTVVKMNTNLSED